MNSSIQIRKRVGCRDARAAGSGRRRKSGEVRRREIAEAAVELLATGSVRDFTAMALAQRVGVSDAALFRHFRGMDHIVESAVDCIEATLFAGFPPEASDPLERLETFFLRRVVTVRANPGLTRLVFLDHLQQAATGPLLERVESFKKRSVAFVRACLAEASSQGLLREDLDVADATVLVIGALLVLGHGRPRSPAVSSPGSEPADGGRVSAVDPAAAGAIGDAVRIWKTLERMIRAAPPSRVR